VLGELETKSQGFFVFEITDLATQLDYKEQIAIQLPPNPKETKDPESLKFNLSNLRAMTKSINGQLTIQSMERIDTTFKLKAPVTVTISDKPED
jgi:hypothetical protein